MVDHLVLRFIVQLRHTHGDVAPTRGWRRSRRSARMSSPVGLKKFLLFSWREMANLEYPIEVARRDRHAVHRVGDLRNKTAILAKCFRKTAARARWSDVEHVLQQALVISDGGSIRNATDC